MLRASDTLRVLVTYMLLLDGLNSKAISMLPTTIFSTNVLLSPSITDTVREPR